MFCGKFKETNKLQFTLNDTVIANNFRDLLAYLIFCILNTEKLEKKKKLEKQFSTLNFTGFFKKQAIVANKYWQR